MVENELTVKHANKCLVMIDNEVIGALQNITISYLSNDYFHEFVGGTEVRKGNRKVNGSFETGLIDTNILKKALGDTTIDIRNVFGIIAKRFHLILDLENEQIKVYYATINSLDVKINSGEFVMYSGTIMAEGLKIN